MASDDRRHEKFNYVEFGAKDLVATKTFFRTVFGWSFVDYGPSYSSFAAKDAGIDGGFFQSDLAGTTATGGALVVFYSASLEETLKNIQANGGAIVKPIFKFPGGRRFHFLEPSGDEFAVWSE